ncbi:MAG: hypothetical protein ACR2LU_06565, partial [Luteitalea sp.]
MARSRWFRRVGIALAVLVAAFIITAALAAALLPPRIAGWIRPRVITVLSRQLDSEVELGELTITLGAQVRISGGPLVVRHQGRRGGAQPFLSVRLANKRPPLQF